MMRQRKYSVAEIDEMRLWLESMAYMGKSKNTEEMLRTYMLNGTDPAELKALHDEVHERWENNQRVAQQRRMVEQVESAKRRFAK